MLRPMAKEPRGLDPGGEVIRMAGCPDCNGRGWFLIHPFKTGGSGGCGGLTNTTQCPTCRAGHDHYRLHGRLPQDIADAMGVDAATCMPVSNVIHGPARSDGPAGMDNLA